MKRPPPPAVHAATKKKEEAAAVPAAESDYPVERKRARNDSADADLISNLPDDILGTIVSLLPTKNGARTQAIARRWRPLWRSAPLNIDADNLDDSCRYPSRIISRILSDHPGPIRRFDFRLDPISATKKRYREDIAHIKSWLNSGMLGNLQELHIIFPLWIPSSDKDPKPYPLLSCVLWFASTVVAATIGSCYIPNEIAPPLSFPLLKHLTLLSVSVTGDILHGVLSACHVLETLLLEENDYTASLHITSPTLRSVTLRDCYMGEVELVMDTPHLERLICIGLDVRTVRVNTAHKLKILGLLSPCFSHIQIGNLVFQNFIPTSSNNSISSVKILALQFSCSDLDAVLDILGFFPCLEKLYVTVLPLVAKMENVRHFDPLDPIKCLQIHFKKLVLKNCKGDEKDVSFAKFFVCNAKVLSEIIFGVDEKIDQKWVANQHALLGVETKASPNAQFRFIRASSGLGVKLDTHDLSVADPFNCLFADWVDALSEESDA